jgi:hypothetical protein
MTTGEMLDELRKAIRVPGGEYRPGLGLWGTRLKIYEIYNALNAVMPLKDRPVLASAYLNGANPSNPHDAAFIKAWFNEYLTYRLTGE